MNAACRRVKEDFPNYIRDIARKMCESEADRPALEIDAGATPSSRLETVVVTAEMLQAGAEAYSGYHSDYERLEPRLEAIFLAMLAAGPTAPLR